MLQRFFILTLFLIVTKTSFAQYQVKGRVLDSLTKTPIEYASIGVFSAADAKVVNGKISDEKGAFNITGLKTGVYHLKIDFIGYQSKSIKNIKLEADKSIDFGIILLKGTEQLLSEVKVESNRNNPINKIDKQVFKADQFESAKGGTTARSLSPFCSLKKAMASVTLSSPYTGDWAKTYAGSPGIMTIRSSLKSCMKIKNTIMMRCFRPWPGMVEIILEPGYAPGICL